MLLNEFEENGYDLERLKPYENFLIECSKKDYNNLGTHKHHILPKFMEGTNDSKNLIELSIEDHYSAHMILANCFNRGTHEYHYNLTSCGKIFGSAKRLLEKHGIEYNEHSFWKIVNIQIKDLSKGENNHMYGKTHDSGAREKISNAQKGKIRSQEWKENHSRKVSGENNGRYGIQFNHSEETKKKLSIKSQISNEKRFPLLEGVFKCDSNIEEKLNRYFRICSEEKCSTILYYSSRYRANLSEKCNCRCKPCSAKKGGEKIRENLRRIPRDRSPNTKTILDPESGKIYHSMKYMASDLMITIDALRKQIKLGKYIYLGKTNAKCI